MNSIATSVIPSLDDGLLDDPVGAKFSHRRGNDMGAIRIAAAFDEGQVLTIHEALINRVFHVTVVDVVKVASDVLGTVDGARLAWRVVLIDDGQYGVGG